MMEIGLPLCKDKIGKSSLIDPSKLVESSRFFRNLRSFSELKRLLFLYDKGAFDQFRSRKEEFTLCKGYSFMLLIEKERGESGILWPMGIGAPNHSVLLEDFIAHGINQAVLYGRAGGLNADMETGDVVICTGAYKDEGTSFHYDCSNRKALPAYELLDAMMNLFPGCPSGDSWTIDAPYRETEEDVRFYRKKNVLTVEMEASAHFTVSRYRKVDAAAAFVISDVFNSDQKISWKEDFSGKKVKKALIDGAEKIFGFLRSPR